MSCQDELRELTRQLDKTTPVCESSRMQVRVNRKELKEPTREEKISNLSNLLLNIDMIECSRLRICEILDQKV